MSALSLRLPRAQLISIRMCFAQANVVAISTAENPPSPSTLNTAIACPLLKGGRVIAMLNSRRFGGFTVQALRPTSPSRVGWAKRSVPKSSACVGTLHFAHPTPLLPYRLKTRVDISVRGYAPAENPPYSSTPSITTACPLSKGGRVIAMSTSRRTGGFTVKVPRPTLQSRVGWAKRSVPTFGTYVGTLRFAHPTLQNPVCSLLAHHSISASK